MAADSAYSSKKAYISKTHVKVKHVLMYEPATIHGLQGEFLWTERQLGLFLALLEDKEAAAKGTCSELQFDHEFDLAINACNVVDDFIRERGGQTGHVFDDFSCLRKFNKELERFKTRMHDFTTRPSIFGRGPAFQYPDLLAAASSLTVPDRNHKEEEKKLPVVGFEVDVQVLSRVLIHDEHKKVVFIVGDKGIGKTTLAMEIYNNTVINHHFQIRAWVNASKRFERKDVLQNIMKEIPEQFMTRKIKNSSSTQELAEVLHHVLSTARCLIVLDGLRSPKAWKALREILPLTWSRIMITTRCRDLAKVEGSREHLVHDMRTLSDQEGWELFNAKVQVPIQLEQLGEKIVRKCIGFPLEILTVGDILSRRDATEEQWFKVLNEYVNPRQKLVLNINAAADALPPNLKDCLSTLELFREEYDIPMRRLIVYWVAEGLVKRESGSNEAPEDLAEKYLMEFIQDNLIQAVKWKLNGKLKTCRVNYFLRDSWLAKAKKEKFLNDNKKKAASHKSFAGTHQFLVVGNLFGNHLRDNRKKAAAAKSSSGTGKILRLADHLNTKEKSFLHIHGNDSISSSSFRQYYGDLRSFVSFDTREGPVPGEDIGNFLRGGIAARCFKMLRVVDFEGAFRPKLPDSIGNLTQLRYLGLRRTYLELLPSSIGKLLNLQTLDLKHSCVKRLPSSIWKLQQLRHLYLTESYRSKIEAPTRISSLVEMQTLWGAFVDEETHIEDSLYRSINLRKLGLAYGLTLSQQKVLAEWISKLKNLESLSLRSIDDMVRPSNLYLKPLSGLNKLSSIYLLGKLDNPVIVHEFPVSLTEITLSISGLEEDPMPKLEKLPNLRILNLYAGSYTGKVMACSSGGFPLLRVLNLWKLEALEEWIVEDGALTILRDLEIRSCVNLKMIPEGLKHLGHCHELKLTKMTDDFKARVTANQGQDWHKIAHIPSVVIKN